ncbi:putative Branched-chain amino acid transport system, Inner-membrane component (plasmid) [Cupriavidus taiwanensis LMG 19424]|uniref:Branched-chain amino acid transport system, Inner-membrane component n=4 Tax=Cupriavidus TaxID=106589 RepID=B2AJ38_CUPTR|nr:ABC transporter permease [Cupriavidus taiwanensis]CAP64088.1 putative Branched-chain amino acid transport system, Inner-membrane component [Cupriavidus taiwanensis LMG 19424]
MLGIALLLPNFVYPVLLMKIMCFALFACAFNLLMGFTGLLSFGHAALFGAAGYVTGYAARDLGIPMEGAIVLGMVVSAILGFLMASLAIRRKGIYFTMITLALAQMVYFVCLQAPVTGGEDGMQGIPRGKLLGVLDLGDDTTMYFVVLAIFVAALALITRIVQSPFGQILRAVKENEPRSISLGYDADRYKLMAFVLSSVLTGLAGSVKAIVLGFETLVDVHWGLSGMVVLMTLVGGVGTLIGPIVGAVVIMVLENELGEIGEALATATHIEWFDALGESVTIVTGLTFIFCVLLFRKGIAGESNAFVARRQSHAIRSHVRRRRDLAHKPVNTR